MKEQATSFRLMTYNIGGGRTQSRLNPVQVLRVIGEIVPDILGIQEVAAWEDADQNIYNVAEYISGALGYFQGTYYGATVSMRENFHGGRKTFRDALFSDYLDWSQGNALLSRWDFARLSDISKLGMPQNISIFQPLQFKGNRDTDPRNAILARVNDGKLYPYVITTHLTTLVGERGGAAEKIPSKVKKAKAMRQQQIDNLLEIIQEHLLIPEALIFLLGDFNADESEGCLKKLIESGFIHIQPHNNHIPTHSFELARPIDHIFVYPASRLIQYECQIIDSPLTREASDHLPVVANVLIKHG